MNGRRWNLWLLLAMILFWLVFIALLIWVWAVTG